MPIKPIGSTLVPKGQLEGYIQLLRDNYQQSNLEQVMCRSQVSVDWQGLLFDCDFNQQLGLPLVGWKHRSLRDLLLGDLNENLLCVAEHCYGCTAGQCSSCCGGF